MEYHYSILGFSNRTFILCVQVDELPLTSEATVRNVIKHCAKGSKLVCTWDCDVREDEDSIKQFMWLLEQSGWERAKWE